VRVIRALRELGVGAVAVYSEVDRDAPHVRLADDAYLLGRARPPRATWTPSASWPPPRRGRPRRSTRATASWPRTPTSRRAASRTGLVFIGPPASAIAAMGSKIRARELMAAAGVPIVPGGTEP
jgi:acetyl-CoA/propionyl-CoA carboxylase biotin carboxyl carrier protein